MAPLVWGAVAAGAAPREPAVAGRFYPAEPERLKAAVRAYLDEAVAPRAEPPVALILPHAGYIFSGQIAADGWRQAQAGSYDVIVILGTNHTTAGFGGVAIHPGPAFRTPLGLAQVDARLAAELIAADPAFVANTAVHEREHSVEVHVPFAQVAFPAVPILPAVVGRPDPELCARFGRALAKAVAGRRALIVASSDLSHYPGYDDARVSDGAVLAAIAGLDTQAVRRAIAGELRKGRPGLDTCACGEAPVLAAIEAAKALGATRGVVLSYANSGDAVVGDRSRVVGYGAVALTRGPAGVDVAALGPRNAATSGTELSASDKKTLLALARQSIAQYLASGTAPLPRETSAALDRRQGVFVTLRKHGELRGCIGHMAEDLPLQLATGRMALAAAFEDARFPPLEAAELGDVDVEVSVLTPAERVAGPEAIRIGEHGVVLNKDGRRAVFLPEVAVEQGWDRTTLLEHLCAKAGLPKDAWKQGAEFAVFRSIHFRESDRL